MEKLRLAKKDELESVYAICLRMKKVYAELGMPLWGEYYPLMEHFQEDLECDGLLVYEVDGIIIGVVSKMTHLIDEGDQQEGVAYLGRFMVEPNLQGKGYGTRIFHATCLWLKDQGYRRIEGLVSNLNKDAMRLYERLGMVNEGYKPTPWEEYGQVYTLFSKNLNEEII